MAKVFDFESIQARLKAYLLKITGWDEILKYSDTHTLIDLQAFGEAELANYIEYLVRETKWDLAINPSSIYKGAGFRGYSPALKQSSTGYVFFCEDPDFKKVATKRVIIPKFTEVQTAGQMSFVTTEKKILEVGALEVAAPVIQGKMVSSTFTATGSGDFEFFYISDSAMENSFFYVTVNDVEWGKVSSIYSGIAGQKIFEVRKESPTKVGFVFGNGRFGKKLLTGDVVKIAYIQSAGSEGNILTEKKITKVASQLYDVNGDFIQMYCRNVANTQLGISAILDGGDDEDDIDAIRSKALGSFVSGDRCITIQDYETNLLQTGLVDKCAVWGAYELQKERGMNSWDNLPTNENLVYVTAISPSGIPLTNAQQESITLQLRNKMAPNAILKFEEPSIMGLIFNIKAYVQNKDVNLTTLAESILASISSRYSLAKMSFKESVYESMWKKEISNINGITYHDSYITLVREGDFANAAAFYGGDATLTAEVDCFVYPMSQAAGAVQIDVRNKEDQKWTHCFTLLSDGTYQTLPASMFNYDNSLSVENYDTGKMAFHLVPKDNSLARVTELDKIRVRYLPVSLDFVLQQKKQIFKYYDSVISSSYME